MAPRNLQSAYEQLSTSDNRALGPCNEALPWAPFNEAFAPEEGPRSADGTTRRLQSGRKQCFEMREVTVVCPNEI